MPLCTPFRSLFFCCLVLIIVPVLLIVLVDVHTPTKPTFRVDSGGSLNSLKVNGTQVTAKFNISVSTNNPTWFSRVYYDAVSAEVFYRGEALVLNKSSLPDFTTHRNRNSVINMTPSVNKSMDFGGPLNGKDGMVEFGLVVSSFTKYKINTIFQSFWWWSFKVVCNPLRFAVSSNEFNTTTSGILLEGLKCTTTWM